MTKLLKPQGAVLLAITIFVAVAGTAGSAAPAEAVAQTASMSTVMAVSCPPSSGVSTEPVFVCTATVSATSGNTAPVGTVSFDLSPSSRAIGFSATGCELGAGAGNASACSVNLAASVTASGSYTVTAAYPGSDQFAASSATTVVTLSGEPVTTTTQPVSTTAPAPRTTVVALHLPAALIKNPPIAELLTPDAHDWLEFEPEPDSYSNDDGTPQVLAEADLKTGKVVEVDPRLAGVETPLILGPDGNVWFGGQNSHGALVLAYVTVRRWVHRFIVTGPSAGEMTGIASGSDGAVWFTWLTHRGTTRLGRMSLNGQTRTFPLARTQEVRSFLPAAGGGFWAAFSRRPTKIDRISTSGQVVRTIDAPLAPATLDAHGALWGFDDQKAQYLDRIENDGQLSRVTGNPPEPNRFAGLEAVVLAADGRLWFTGDSGAATDHPGQDPDIENLLGEVEPDLSVQTWPTAFSNEDEAPQGNQYVSPPLAAGPDGRLYAIGNVPQANMSWDLLAITLPDQPAMRPASVHFNGVTSRGHAMEVRLSCTGQPGRICDGTISVQDGSRTTAKQAYALTPGLQATHTLTTAAPTANDSVIVSTIDPLTHSVETQHVRASP